MWERIRHIVRKEFLEMFRDPKMKFVLFVLPLFQVIVFGYATSTDVDTIPTAIYDLDNTYESRQLIRQFSYSGYFHIVKYISSDQEQRYLIDRNIVNTVIRINRRFAQELLAQRSAPVQIILDGTDSLSASQILPYVNSVIQQFSASYNQKLFLQVTDRGGTIPQVELRQRCWFNENLDSHMFHIPGVVGLIVFIVTFVLTAMSIVKEKEVGTIEQLMVSPIRPIELIMGKLIPYATIGFLDVIILTLVAVFWFHVPFRGNIFLLLVCAALFLLTTLGMGLLISIQSKTQQEAMMVMFMIAQPMVMLSGFSFAITNMPEFFQMITFINPLRYFMEIMRALFLKGIGISLLWPKMAALFGIGVIIITISSSKFQKTIG